MLTMYPWNDSDSPMMQMGTPGGHILPGVLFIWWGIWTVLVAWTKYHSSFHEYRTTCHPVPADKKVTRGKRMVRLFFFAAPVIGMLGEAISGKRLSSTFSIIGYVSGCISSLLSINRDSKWLDIRRHTEQHPAYCNVCFICPTHGLGPLDAPEHRRYSN